MGVRGPREFDGLIPAYDVGFTEPDGTPIRTPRGEGG
jgi:hypothetical protein